MSHVIHLAPAVVAPAPVPFPSRAGQPSALTRSTSSTRRSTTRSRRYEWRATSRRRWAFRSRSFTSGRFAYAVPMDAPGGIVTGRNRRVHQAPSGGGSRHPRPCVPVPRRASGDSDGVHAAFTDRGRRPAQLVADRVGTVASDARSRRPFRGVRRHGKSQRLAPARGAGLPNATAVRRGPHEPSTLQVVLRRLEPVGGQSTGGRGRRDVNEERSHA